MERVLNERSIEAEQLHQEVLDKTSEIQRLQRLVRESDNLRREFLVTKDTLAKVEHERGIYRDRSAELETRVAELNDLFNLELAKGYESEQQKVRMREDFERQRQDMERDAIIRNGDRERELLLLKSELLR